MLTTKLLKGKEGQSEREHSIVVISYRYEAEDYRMCKIIRMHSVKTVLIAYYSQDKNQCMTALLE